MRESTSQACDIDFHMESASLMLMEGDNTSALCDATCFQGQGSIQVTWMDARARQISSFPGRVFSVRYNRGLMNRLMVIRARADTAGHYVCSVTRGGQLLQQQPLEIVVLGTGGNNDNFRPVDTGPRRGDMIPEQDLEYRPVRSADRPRCKSAFGASDETSNTFLDGTATDLDLDTNVGRVGHSSVKNAMFASMLSQQDLHQSHDFITRKKDGEEQTGSIQTLNKQTPDKKIKARVHDLVDFVRNRSRTLSKSPKVVRGGPGPDGLTMSNIPDGVNLTPRKALGQRAGFIRPFGGLSRVKRQQENATTTQEPDTIPPNFTADGGSGDLNQTTLLTNASDEAGTFAPTTDTGTEEDTTHEGNAITETTTHPKQNAQTEMTQKESAGKSGNGNDGVTPTPCSRAQESVNFGKYGVLAFALTLAVAVLLVYTILMIIFMPRIMARRKNKQDLEGGAYRKTGVDANNMAPMTILESGNVLDSDPPRDKLETSDLDRSGSGSETSDSGKKDGDSNEISASVSTFLLRQESQRKSVDGGSKGEASETKDSEETSSPPLTPADPAPALQQDHQEPQTTPANTNVKDEDKLPPPSDDLLSSFLPGFDALVHNPPTENQP